MAMWRGIGLLRESAGSHSVGRLWKRWIDTMKECLKKRGLEIRESGRIVQDRIEWLGFLRGINP